MTYFSWMSWQAMARYSLIFGGKTSVPSVFLADFLVMHRLSGIFNNSSSWLMLRLASSPRPDDSLVNSSTVSVEMAMGCGASPHPDASSR